VAPILLTRCARTGSEEGAADTKIARRSRCLDATPRLVDQNKNLIYLYAPPYTAPAYATIALNGTTIDCTLSTHETRLYCLDYEYGSVDVYSYPTGTYIPYIYSFTNGINANADPGDITFSTPHLTIK